MKFLLVGQAFHPGAHDIIARGFIQATPVLLIPEPSNPFDPLAVRVAVERKDVIDSPALTDALLGFGLTLDSVVWPFDLGHLAAKYETKTAKAARAAGHSFELCAEWHKASPSEGRLLQYPDGVMLVETA